jgi:hypothetical protein
LENTSSGQDQWLNGNNVENLHDDVAQDKSNFPSSALPSVYTGIPNDQTNHQENCQHNINMLAWLSALLASSEIVPPITPASPQFYSDLEDMCDGMTNYREEIVNNNKREKYIGGNERLPSINDENNERGTSEDSA